DLGDRGSTSIKNLSGGQVKRASLANEIISQPNLLFVDEATSGLDEHTDGEIMQIFRRIAEDGKTVVCITHNLTNVEKSCHKVVVLAPGGYLAFVGTPDEAKEYFGIPSLGDVYNRLRSKPAQDWQHQFAETPTCQHMRAQIQSRVANSSSDVDTRRKQPFSQLVAIFLRQLILLFRRGLEVQLCDVKSLLMMGVQCLFVALLICILFGQIPEVLDILGKRGPFGARVLFLLTISSFWFGCNNAAKEIVKEKEIYERERDVCLNVISYYAAKFLLLGLITAVQIVALLWIVRFSTGLPGTLLPQLWSLTLIGLCGVATGLLISTIASNTDMAVTLVPVAIIPQVILAGVIWQVEGSAKLLSQLFISCYWGYGNVVSTVPAAAEAAGFEEWNYFGSGIFLMFHIIILVIAANAILYSFDKRLSLQGTGIDNWVKNASHLLHGVIDTVAKPAAGNTQPPPVPAEPQPLASDAPPD
ncbi:MAG: ABC transporter permease, partial [Pirellulaceae bacterium]